MDLQPLCSVLEQSLTKLFAETHSAIVEREDSRAFGAMIEKQINQQWPELCKQLDLGYLQPPGRRTIYDVACHWQNQLIGFDIKTKDLDSNKYSDGGVCAVGNLLKYMANDKGVLCIIEFGHNRVSEKSTARDLEYIRVAPFHIFPADTYRIENLGTGQLRLNYSLNQIWSEIDWNRSYAAFFDIFCDLAIRHYMRVKADAEKRIGAIEEFKKCGYEKFQFPR